WILRLCGKEELCAGKPGQKADTNQPSRVNHRTFDARAGKRQTDKSIRQSEFSGCRFTEPVLSIRVISDSPKTSKERLSDMSGKPQASHSNPVSQSPVSAHHDSEEYEEISSEEVDRVVEALDHLIEVVQSENIKHYLEEAASSIYYLVYEDEANADRNGISEKAA
ncbi:MAG: hypothetical protein ACK526_06070, partial [Planctomyces sp.]